MTILRCTYKITPKTIYDIDKEVDKESYRLLSALNPINHQDNSLFWLGFILREVITVSKLNGRYQRLLKYIHRNQIGRRHYNHQLSWMYHCIREGATKGGIDPAVVMTIDTDDILSYALGQRLESNGDYPKVEKYINAGANFFPEYESLVSKRYNHTKEEY
jgi:hypothetical protein